MEQTNEKIKDLETMVLHGVMPTFSIEETGKIIYKQKVFNSNDYKNIVKGAEEGNLHLIPEKIRNKFAKKLQVIQKQHVEPLDAPHYIPRGVWYYGPGASEAVRKAFPDAYIKPLDKWWDDYKGEKTVIMLGLEKKHKKLYHMIKQCGDWCGIRLERRRKASTASQFDKFIVASNFTFEEIFARFDWWFDITRVENGDLLLELPLKFLGKDLTVNGPYSKDMPRWSNKELTNDLSLKEEILN